MMPAKGKDFVRDYVLRTKENYLRLERGPYEVTQLINSAIGLLIIPQQKFYNEIADNMVSEELLNKIISCSHDNTYQKPLDLSQIARHLRNSIAHARIEFVAEKSPMRGNPPIIHAIKFRDENDRTKETITIELTIELLKEFFFAFADAASKL